MDINWGEVQTGVIIAVLTGAGGSAWLIFSKHGQEFWSRLGTVMISVQQPEKRDTNIIKVEGIRIVFALTILSLVLALILAVGAIIHQFGNKNVSFKIVSVRPISAKKHSDPAYPKDTNWEVNGACPADSQIVSYFCQVDAGGGNLQNSGIEVDRFTCVWNSVDDKTQFVAHGTPLCLRGETK